ncbi:hypothetical protein ACFU5N_07625 [Streptomyces albidoflavus]
MASFATHRRRVHDPHRSARARHAALRTCVTLFAPYGFRATYHHLCRSARLPADLDSDPAALVRAVEELHEARQLWLAEAAAFAARRRAEKAAGVRAPGEPPRLVRGPEGSLAYCPDPEAHPTARLAEVVRALRPAAGPGCPLCGGTGPDVTVPWDSGRRRHLLCARCGISLRTEATTPDPALPHARAERWRQVWRRTA